MIFAFQTEALTSIAGLGKGNEQVLLIEQTTEKPPSPQSINGLSAHREDRGVDCLIWRAGVLNTWSSPNCASPHAEAITAALEQRLEPLRSLLQRHAFCP